MTSDPTHPMLETISRGSLINELIIDMIANTDCSWYAATAAIAFWQSHYENNTAPIYGLVEHKDPEKGDEKPNVCYESGKTKRSLKIGAYIGDDPEATWMLTLHS